jgi:hypothetical protein
LRKRQAACASDDKFLGSEGKAQALAEWFLAEKRREDFDR